MQQDLLASRLVELHASIRQSWPELTRMAVAVYDAETDELKTFINSTRGHEPLRNYQARLVDVPSLQEVAESRTPRIMDDLRVMAGSGSTHTRWLLDAGFRSSYTVPLYGGEHLVGFLFFDAEKADYFSEQVVRHLAVYSELVCSIITGQMALIHVLNGALNTVRHISAQRDGETEAHTRRVSHYARFIAQQMAESHELSDEYIEYLYQFSPLHDIGKIGVPDDILLKQGRLDAGEYEHMKGHVERGLEIIDSIISEFDLGGLKHLPILRNIVAAHHERYDGTGYPNQLMAEEIPLEARITAVADVLDALTTRRPYKQPWEFDEAIAYLQQQSGTLFDADCVNALVGKRAELVRIRERFQEPRS